VEARRASADRGHVILAIAPSPFASVPPLRPLEQPRRRLSPSSVWRSARGDTRRAAAVALAKGIRSAGRGRRGRRRAGLGRRRATGQPVRQGAGGRRWWGARWRPRQVSRGPIGLAQRASEVAIVVERAGETEERGEDHAAEDQHPSALSCRLHGQSPPLRRLCSIVGGPQKAGRPARGPVSPVAPRRNCGGRSGTSGGSQPPVCRAALVRSLVW